MPRSKPLPPFNATDSAICLLSDFDTIIASHVVPADVRRMDQLDAVSELDQLNRLLKRGMLEWVYCAHHYREVQQHVKNLALDAYDHPENAEWNTRAWLAAVERAACRGRSIPRTPEFGWHSREYDGIGDSLQQTRPRHYGTGVWGASTTTATGGK